jgi:hypothetical protein
MAHTFFAVALGNGHTVEAFSSEQRASEWFDGVMKRVPDAELNMFSFDMDADTILRDVQFRADELAAAREYTALRTYKPEGYSRYDGDLNLIIHVNRADPAARVTFIYDGERGETDLTTADMPSDGQEAAAKVYAWLEAQEQ